MFNKLKKATPHLAGSCLFLSRKNAIQFFPAFVFIPSSKREAVCSYSYIKRKGRCVITRILLFLISYGLLVVSISHVIFYFNYRTLGYEWSQVFYFIIRTSDFALLVISAITLIITVSYRGPSRSPFFSE